MIEERKKGIKRVCQSLDTGKERVVCYLPSGNSPNLLNGVKIGRIGRQIDKDNSIEQIAVFAVGVLFDQSLGFLVPRSVIHNNIVFLSVGNGIARNEITQRVYDRLVIEHGRLVDVKHPCFWNHIAGIRSAVSARIGLDLRLATFAPPFSRNQRVYCKMNLILKDKNGVGIVLQIV